MTKRALELKTRQILNVTKLDTFVTEEEQNWLTVNVFVLHPDWIEKQGTGVKAVKVRLNSSYLTRGFELLLNDDTVVDIGIGACFKKYSKRDQYLQSMRNAVQEQIVDFACVNNVMPGFDAVDHKTPFIDLVEQFESQYAVDWASLKIKHEDNTSKGDRLENLDFEKNWQNWHKQHAILQKLSEEEHKRKTEIERKARKDKKKK